MAAWLALHEIKLHNVRIVMYMRVRVGRGALCGPPVYATPQRCGRGAHAHLPASIPPPDRRSLREVARQAGEGARSTPHPRPKGRRLLCGKALSLRANAGLPQQQQRLLLRLAEFLGGDPL